MTDRSSTPKGQRARERILAAAEELLARGGFHGTSTRDIAAAARIPHATCVYHFARKEQLYAAVLEHIAAELVAELTRLSATATTARWPEILDELARGFARWAALRPDRVKLLVRELLDNPVRLPRAHKLPLAPVLERAAALVAAADAAGACDAGDPEVAVLHFVGALSYFVAAWPTVERIVGPARARKITSSYEREVMELARRVFGSKETVRATRSASPAGAPRARPPRGSNDRSRGGTDARAGVGVRRSGAVRARARAAVSRAATRGRARLAARQAR
jgi:AcrR family transcriptional regulator